MSNVVSCRSTSVVHSSPSTTAIWCATRCLAAPAGFGVLVNLSAVTRVSPVNLAELRRLAGQLGAAGHQVAFVCTELMLRAELIVGDLDTVAPVLAADEQAVPLLSIAA